MAEVPVAAGLRLVEAQLQGQIRALAFLRGTPDAARHQELRHGGLLVISFNFLLAYVFSFHIKFRTIFYVLH